MQTDFNSKYRNRTRAFAIQLCRTLKVQTRDEVSRIIIKQVVRSGSSVTSTFYAATRARSSAEFYSKLCIVVEECDETAFWMDLLISAELVESDKIEPLRKEALKLLYVFATVRKNLKEKIKESKLPKPKT
jgi:four helix bundle protein